jgi:outer membrane receptor protein involved in Fe transport
MTIKTITRGAFALLATTLALPAIAQEDVAIFEEITVLATKREQTLQQVPVAVSVVSAEVMNEAQVLDIADLQTLVPSLRVSTLQTAANTTFLIRGFGNGANNVGVEPSVGVFVDGVYRSRTAASIADLPNLERIEVIKGPQSTLFGKNASAGVINIVTAKPSLDGYSGLVSGTIGEYNQIIGKAEVNGPLSDTFAWGLAANFNQRDGYFTNLGTGSEFNETNRYGVRGQLLWQPSDTFEARLIADYDEIDELCCGVANLALSEDSGLAIGYAGGTVIAEQPFAYEQNYNFDATNKIENSGISLQLDWDLNDYLTLTSITALRKLERFDNSDSDFNGAEMIGEFAGNLTDTELDTFTQELRLSGSNGSVDWLVGAFYFDEEAEQRSSVGYGSGLRPYFEAITTLAALPDGTPLAQKQAVLGALGLGLVDSPLTLIEDGIGLPNGTFFGEGQGSFEFGTLENTATSLFAQADIGLGERATLTLGINYTEDEKDVTLGILGTDVFSRVSLPAVGFGLAFEGATGLPPTPENILLVGQQNPELLGVLQAGSTTNCTDGLEPPFCNQLLVLQPLQFLPPFVDFPNAVEPGTSKDDNTSWTARFAFDLTDSLNAYVSAGTGFKATSWNLSRDSRPFAEDIGAIQAGAIAATGAPIPNLAPGTRYAGPEESTLYEIGLKGQFDRISINMAIFDQEIEGFQENVFQGTGFVLTNAGKQSSTGVEIDLLWAITDNFDFFIAGLFQDPTYDDYQNAPGVGGPTDLSGTQVPGISETSINTWARYEFDVGANASAFVRAEYYYESETQVISNVPESVAAREVSMINASAGMRWDNGFEVMLWGRNLTDDEFLQSAFPTTVQPADNYSGYPNQPRTYGLTVRKYFD